MLSVLTELCRTLQNRTRAAAPCQDCRPWAPVTGPCQHSSLQHLSAKVENLFPATSLSLLLLKKYFLILKLLFIDAEESWSHWTVEFLGACNDVLMTATCESAYTCLILITGTALLKSMKPCSRHNLSAFFYFRDSYYIWTMHTHLSKSIIFGVWESNASAVPTCKKSSF